MSQAEPADFDDLRSVAESLIHSTYRGMPYPRTGNVMSGSGGAQMHPAFDMSRTHSINLITEEFLGGYMQDGRMSVVRRFFCLFVTFDLIFISLLWLICIMINGDNIFQAFQKQILHYTIYTSLFDVVVAAICRFVVLIFFYALLYINHWLVIALSTSGSCLFLISKVFVFDWVDSHQQVLEVIIIITSFVIAWGEAWFLDCRVIPQERHASHYFSSMNFDRAPLIAPFLSTQGESRPPESVANFYSPLDSAHNSDAEDELDDDYTRMGVACVENAYALLESGDWKMEKVTPKGDTIQSTQRDKVGKVYKLTGHLKYSAKALTEELFYKIEDMPKWNPTILESKIVRKINSYTDITYQATVGGGGGIVKSRDFVNLRCLRFFRNGKLCEDTDTHTSSDEGSLNRSCEGSVSTISDVESYTPQSGSVNSSRAKFSTSSTGRLLNENNGETLNSTAFQTLSKSLGAKGFSTASAMPPIHFDEPPPLEEHFEDAKDNLEETAARQPALVQKTSNEKVWISAAISIDYPNVPPTTKYTRGENIVSGFAMREIAGKSDACIFEWIICLDLKGYIPRYVLDTAYTTFMTDYMTHLRKYVSEMRHRHRRIHKH